MERHYLVSHPLNEQRNTHVGTHNVLGCIGVLLPNICYELTVGYLLDSPGGVSITVAPVSPQSSDLGGWVGTDHLTKYATESTGRLDNWMEISYCERQNFRIP